MLIVYLVLLFFTLSTTLILSALFLLLIRDGLTSEVPFVPFSRRYIPQVIEALALSDDSVFYDLGSGDGRFLVAVHLKNKNVRVIGVEKGIVPFWVSKFKTKNIPAQVLFKDIFEANLHEATHICCYLSNDMMKKLKPKILEECQPGTRIVSSDFTFPDWIPEREIILHQSKNRLTRKLYIYVVKK